METYIVNGTHVHPDYQLQGALFEVRKDQDRFYATNRKLGCSKSYASPEIAIRQMCADHAITVTGITKL